MQNRDTPIRSVSTRLYSPACPELIQILFVGVDRKHVKLFKFYVQLPNYKNKVEWLSVDKSQ